MLSPLTIEHGQRYVVFDIDALLLLPSFLVKSFLIHRHHVYFYTPVLSENLVTQFLPPRWNEVLSVYHIKSYIFDNNMIIGGANLSNEYFTKRIDRYVLFEDCADLISVYERFFSILSRYCSSVAPSGKISTFCTFENALS